MIGYAVAVNPGLASFRLRVALPAPHTGHKYAFGALGDVSFFYKLGDPALAEQARGPVVFDVVNDHFRRREVREMCGIATVLTAGSEAMAETVFDETGRDAVVIDDPWETDEMPAACDGDRVLWFGHSANLPSLNRYADRMRGTRLVLCTNYSAPGVVPWTLASEAKCLDECAVVLMTGTNPGASSNRVVKALRAGRFVVCPADCAKAWRQFAEFVWIGDVREGVDWALNNRQEAVRKIQAGQQYVRERFGPQTIGRQWGALFDSTLGRATSVKTAG